MAYYYSHSKKDVLNLTRRQLSFYLEKVGTFIHNERNFQASVHGMKMKEPLREVDFTDDEDDKISKMIAKRFEEMQLKE